MGSRSSISLLMDQLFFNKRNHLDYYLPYYICIKKLQLKKSV